jgi:hypothetical protein
MGQEKLIECGSCELRLVEELTECEGLSCAISVCWASHKQFTEWREFEDQLLGGE